MSDEKQEHTKNFKRREKVWSLTEPLLEDSPSFSGRLTDNPGKRTDNSSNKYRWEEPTKVIRIAFYTRHICPFPLPSSGFPPPSLKDRNGVLGKTVKVITQSSTKWRSLKWCEGHKQEINMRQAMKQCQSFAPHHATTGHKAISLLEIDKERGKEEARPTSLPTNW